MTLYDLPTGALIEYDGQQFEVGPLVRGNDSDVCGRRLYPVKPHRLRSTGDGHRDKLVAAKINLRSEA